MTVSRKEVSLAIATLLLVGYALSLSLAPVVMSLVQTSAKLANQGSIKTVGVGVYSDSACTNVVTSINWGTIDPGARVNKTVYIKNEGNAASTLSMSTSNWNPTTASTYLTLTWNYSGQAISVNQAIQVKFTLAVSSSVSSVTSFSFDISIVSTG